jgi:hypothetical protein
MDILNRFSRPFTDDSAWGLFLLVRRSPVQILRTGSESLLWRPAPDFASSTIVIYFLSWGYASLLNINKG